jgi:hypothetical protein
MTTTASSERYKLVFFVPTPNLPDVKAAIFATGAGKIGDYTKVCFTTPGIGQFIPGNASHPVIGEVGKLEEVGEVRCETVCPSRSIVEAAVAALRK